MAALVECLRVIGRSEEIRNLVEMKSQVTFCLLVQAIPEASLPSRETFKITTLDPGVESDVELPRKSTSKETLLRKPRLLPHIGSSRDTRRPLSSN